LSPRAISSPTGGINGLLVQTVELVPRFATAWFALGAIRDRLGDRAGAVAAFTEARDADPEDYHGARLQLARLGAGEAAPEMTETYVRRLFDQYAGRYDAALVDHLAYRGPAILRGAVETVVQAAQRPLHFDAILDLGCGTGLGGAAFRPLTDRMVGVDLSPAMIAQAEAKGIYDRLITGNIADCLAEETAAGSHYQLILAADVFVYVNDLKPILAAVAQLLPPDGLLAFTVETHARDGVKLLPTLRFAYGEAYLREAIAEAGLAVLQLSAAAVRTEKGVPVHGLVIVAGMPSDQA
jgi:predicted TPR repeat methyltransferase